MRFLPVCSLFLALGAVQAFGAAADGKPLFESKCKMCHGADGAKMMKPGMRPLGSAEVQAKSDADLAKNITQGVGKMPKVALTDAQAADVVAYLRTLKK